MNGYIIWSILYLIGAIAIYNFTPYNDQSEYFVYFIFSMIYIAGYFLGKESLGERKI